METQVRVKATDIKIFKRYSLRILFTGILSLLMIGLFVAMLFLPIGGFSIVSGDVAKEYSYKGMDVLVAFFRIDSSTYEELLKSIGSLGDKATIEPGVIRLLANAFFLVVPMLFLVAAFHLIFLAIFGFKLLIYGKVNDYKAPTSLSRAAAFCVFLMSGMMIAYNFLFPSVTNNNLKVINVLYNYIFVGAGIGIWVAIHAIYYMGLKKGYCSSDVEIVNEQPTVVSSYAPLGGDNKKAPEQVGSSIPNSTEVYQTKKDMNPAIGLPSNISSIGGHAFASNMNLRLAVIPNGIPSIGEAAFANCGNLCLLSIPRSVKSIGMNAFFNCQNLKRINYEGTKAEWAKISRGSNWLFQGGTNIVVCADGTIVVDPLS